MMNQRIIIYIILSAILLYLYYRRQDITVFAAFIVVVGTTLIFRGDAEGFGFGGGGGGDKECAKMGFKEPKIDKKDINGSLEKVTKNVKTVASKYIKFDEKYTGLKEKYNDPAKFIGETEILKSELEKFNKNKENKEYATLFGILTYERIVVPYMIMPSEKAQDKALEALGKLNKKDDNGQIPITMILKGGPIILNILNKIKKSDEMKEANKDVKELISVSICSVKHFISLWKNIQKANGGGGDDAGDDAGDAGDEEKPKKKKKEEDGDDEEEKPKKKKKKKEEDDAGDE